jgi:hypothetical protein
VGAACGCTRHAFERYTGVCHRVSVAQAPESDQALAADVLDGIRGG